MRFYILSLLLFVGSSSLICAQGHTPTFSPEDTISFIKIKLMNPDGSAYANSKVLVRGEKGYETIVKTDKRGQAKAKVRIGDTYSFITGAANEHTAFRKVVTNDFPYVTYSMQGYTRRFVYFTFLYTNLRGKPLKGEAVRVTSNTGKVYTDTTNKEGKAIFELPFDKQFVVGVDYHPSATVLSPTDVNKEYKVMKANFSWIGTVEKKRRERVADSLARVHAARMKIYTDSIEKVMAKEDSLRKVLGKEYGTEFTVELERYVSLSCGSTRFIEKVLGQKATLYKKLLEEDPLCFEKKRKAVLAPLYRLRKKFVNKIIVTDITGSMSPYMEEVMLWHALNFVESEGQGTKYLFFNDGNDLADADKIVGETKGFYYTEGNRKDFGSILGSMRRGMRYGGGDGPENDIEALLAATSKREKNDEVILIADNYSTMRDIELLSELKIPVRVVVCGVEDSMYDFGDTGISEEYLDLARETGGSIHTIKEDVFDLAQVQEGNSIVIDGIEYQLNYGKFIRKKKM